MPSRARVPNDPVTQLADRLHSSAIHVLRRVRREDEAIGLSAARLAALSVIVYAGPIRISALARAEQVRTPTMTPIVAALEREGFIERQPDALDARAALLTATPKGRRVLAEGRARRVTRLAAELRRLNAAERRALERAVGSLERLFGTHDRHAD
jgi:DNA-binding MarR family transcriptional regulator